MKSLYIYQLASWFIDTASHCQANMRHISVLAVVLLLQALQHCKSATVPNPVEITPRRVIPPTDADETGCTQKSRSPSWEVRGLYYNRLNFGPPCVSPSGTCGGPFGPPQTLYYGELVFDLVNMATGESHHCDVRYLGLSDLTGDNEWLPCVDSIIFINVPNPQPADNATTSLFHFNHTSNTLALNQTWYCDDRAGDREGYSFTAYGAASPALDSGAVYIGNRALGEVHVNGSSPVIPVPGTVVSERLVPTAQARQEMT